MRAWKVVRAVLSLSFVFLPISALAVCGPSCEPDPASGTYQQTITARPLPHNGRGNPLDIVRHPVDPLPPKPLGSESYNYSMPLLHLPGRNGLDLDLTLYYNSHVWTKNITGATTSTVTFNADRDWPSYGFRLGYGYIEYAPNDATNTYVVTERDGTKHQLVFAATNSYNSNDSTYMNYNSSTKVLVYKNGTRITYEAFKADTNPTGPRLFRPKQIKDTNGNYITITYIPATDQSIYQITDTLGRVLTFNYGSGSTAGLLIGVTQGTKVFTFSWNTAYVLNYNFGTGITVTDSPASGGPALNVLSGMMYPNSTSYLFTYGDYGIVNGIFNYSATGALRSSVSYNFPSISPPALTDLPTFWQQTVNDGNNTASWTYSSTKSNNRVATSTVTDPSTGNGPAKITITTLNTTGNFIGMPQNVQITDGTTVFQTTAFTWVADATTFANPRQDTVTITNDAGQQSKAAYTYTTNGNVATIAEYNFGLALARTTAMSYLTTGSYPAQHILDRLTQVQVKDPAGTVQAQTNFVYDGTTPTSQTGVQNHDDSGYGTGFNTRGNVTQVTRYSNASALTGPISRNFAYDMLGNLRSAQVDCCVQKTFAYDASTKYAFPTSITSGSSPTLTTASTYDSQFRLSTSTDENSQSVSYGYDAFDRVTTVNRNADGVVFNITYDDNNARPVTQTSSTANAAVQKSFVEGNGRVRRDLYNGASLVSSVVSYVDALGRTYKTSNPFGPSDTELYTQTTFDILSRPITIAPPSGGSSQIAYSGNTVTMADPAGKLRRNYSDALGRLIRVDEPGWGDIRTAGGSVVISGGLASALACCLDNGHSYRVYDSGTVSITVNGAAKTVNYGINQNTTSTAVASALVTAINADSAYPASASLSGSTVNLTSKVPGFAGNYSLSAAAICDCSLTGNSYTTAPSGSSLTGGLDAVPQTSPNLTQPITSTYTYNVLNKLTNISNGYMVTTAGVTYPPQTRTYNYDSLGRPTSVSAPESGATTYTYFDFGGVQTRTDARGIVTTYGYDGLNRLATISYSDGTPTVTDVYGTLSAGNNNGRLLSSTAGSGAGAVSHTYSYNNIGQITQDSQVIEGTTYNLSYSYNAAGELTSLTYPSGRVVQQAYDPIGRLQSIIDSANQYLTAPTYNAAGQALGFNYGNGVQAAFVYNDHLQVSSIRYTKSAADLINLTYGYTATQNDGQIATITDSMDSSKSMAYTYDAWGRLATAQAGPSGNPTWTLSWTMDRFGNDTNQSAGPGAAVPTHSLVIDPNTNHITGSGFSYDAAGNMTADGTGFHTYTYDAENRAKTVDTSAANYKYDPNSLRVKKTVATTNTVYVFSGSIVIAEYSGISSLTLSKEYVYSGSNLLATVAGSTVTYSHADHLSTRVETDTAGLATRTYGHFPYGENWYETGAPNKLKFTSYERDAESGLDYALMRLESSRLGRFMSPDPLGGSPGNPQSLNRYAYAINEPINHWDPLGLGDVVCSIDQNGNYVCVVVVTDNGSFNDFVKCSRGQGPGCSQGGGDDGDRDPGRGGGGGRDGCQLGQAVCNTVDQIRRILQSANCLKAVTGKDSPSTDLDKDIDKALNNIYSYAGQNQAGPHGEHEDAHTTQGVIGAPIFINDFGGFYQETMRNNTNNGAVNLFVGTYRGRSQSAKDLTLLHEVAHQFKAIPSDAGTKDKPDFSQSTTNTSNIEKACGSAINAVTGAK